MMDALVSKLAQRWEAAWNIAPPQVRREVFDEVIAAYTNSNRHYHDLRHIAACLREFDSVKQLARNSRAVEAAIWFHDVVYDGHRQDNEEQSADFAMHAMARLGADDALRHAVRDLVLFTRHDRDPGTNDGKLMVDIDLASLGLPADAFDANGDAIRQEYAHVPEADFRKGRASLLGRFLSRPRIYLTDEFFARYEEQARKNLRRSLNAINA
jgi:predicted metal-dependent HD superfamily phosphohydrolase